MENENIQKTETKKENGKRNLLLILIMLLVVIIVGAYVLISMPKKEVEVYREPEPVAVDVENPIKIISTTKTNKVDIYNEAIDINIPGINATVEGAKKLNEKILSDYSKIIEEAKKDTPYIVSYEYKYYPNMKYLVLNITTKLSSNMDIQTYIYDSKQDKEVLLSELYAKYNFTIDKLKARLKYLNLVDIDIQSIDNKTVEDKIFLSDINETKLIIGYVYNLETTTVTFNVNEKNAEYIVMDSINIKEDKGTATTDRYKLYTNIKLPKIKLETTNATLINNKINNIYTDIQNYYVVEEKTDNIENSENKEEVKKELINSYETSYKYGYIEELGLVYITITKNVISGKDDERSGEKQKIEPEYFTYIYNVSEDKEEDILKVFDLFKTSKENITKNIIQNNSKEGTSIQKAAEEISNFSIDSLTANKLVVKLKVDNIFYDVTIEK